MPLAIESIISTPSVAPGPFAELLVHGINGNLVPDPFVTNATTWSTIIAGTYPGIVAATIPSAWARSTTVFLSSPASLRVQTTGTGGSGNIHITPWIPCQGGQTVTLQAALRITQTDSTRIPRMSLTARTALGVEVLIDRISWPVTVSASFVNLAATFTIPPGLTYTDFRVRLSLEGTAVSAYTAYFDNMSVILQGGATKIDIWRQWGGKEVQIPGGYDISITGETMQFFDYGIPFGTPVSYRVMTSVNGVLREAYQSNPITVNETGMWLSDPLTPMMAIKVVPDARSLKTHIMPFDGLFFGPVGREESILIGEQRRADEGIPVGFITYTQAQRFALELLFRNTNPVMCRSSQEHNLPPLCYLGISAITKEFIDAPEGDTVRFTGIAALVASPPLDVLVPIRTYAEAQSESSDYTGWLAQRANYLELLRG